MFRFISIFLLGAFLSSCASKDKKAKPVSSNGNPIAYSISGKADTTLLFIHGWCINQTYWKSQVDFFSPRYQVLTIDLPGFGLSGKELGSDWRFGNYTADIKALVDQLELKKLVLIGHSMSGDLILDYAQKYPGDLVGIVGIDNLHQPAGQLSEVQKLEVETFFDKMFSSYDSIVQNMMAVDLFQPSTDSSIRKRVLDDILRTKPEIAVKVLKENSLFTPHQQEAMRSLPFPLFLLNSDVYPVNADSLNKYCKLGYQLETIKGSGHYPMLEQPDAFNQALQKLLDRISKPQ
ncbi:MAG: alpha/beta hydrolase [Chitinophagaceae bacterium]|nr:alpha/beta hydrolase [Chitinophagaceae bacterium]MBP6589409.1 alpha/beta hydrolase [Chitinophagaceae bacterium]MBP8244160.1 alpha/beta hydrolase [Chitinophagaceae bacterium]